MTEGVRELDERDRVLRVPLDEVRPPLQVKAEYACIEFRNGDIGSFHILDVYEPRAR